MPDMKSELTKIIHAWETPVEEPKAQTPNGKVHRFNVTNNVSRVTFDFVRDNPGALRRTVTSTLIARGYKKGSVDALLSAMLQQGLVRYEGRGLFATQPEYVPVKAYSSRVAAKRRASEAQCAPAPKVGAPTPSPAVPVAPVAPVASAKPAVWDPVAFVDTLTLRQARSVYDELHKIFCA